MRNAKANTSKAIRSKSRVLLAYADDVGIIGQTMIEVSSVFSKIEKILAKVRLVVNEDRTKLMVSTSKASSHLDQSVNVDNRYNFEELEEFTYIGSGVNKNNNVSLEIKRRIVLALLWAEEVLLR